MAVSDVRHLPGGHPDLGILRSAGGLPFLGKHPWPGAAAAFFPVLERNGGNPENYFVFSQKNF